MTEYIDITEGERGFDGRFEFEIADISPDGFEITIQYTHDGSTQTYERNEFARRQDDELFVV